MVNNLFGKHIEFMEYSTSSEDVSKSIKETFIREANFDPDHPLITPHLFEEFSNMKPEDILCIYAGYISGPKGFNILNGDIRLIEKYINENYKQGQKILFDNLHEGGVDILLVKIHELIRRCNLPASSVYYMTCVVDIKERYDDFCARNNIAEKINVASANPWEKSATFTANRIDSRFVIGPKDKKFICFNRICRPHRLMLTSTLLKNDLIKDSYYSFFPGLNHGQRDTTVAMVDIFNNLRHLMQNDEMFFDLEKVYQKNVDIFPLKINIEGNNNKTTVDKDDISYFENSYFSLVTETFYFDLTWPPDFNLSVKNEHCIFFSEKIFKPIIMKHPFMIVSRPKSLAALRQIGYKTFHPYINEEYDLIENNVDRMNAIVREVKRLSAFTTEQWLEWLKNVEEICLYNHEVLKNKRDFVYGRYYV